MVKLLSSAKVSPSQNVFSGAICGYGVPSLFKQPSVETGSMLIFSTMSNGISVLYRFMCTFNALHWRIWEHFKCKYSELKSRANLMSALYVNQSLFDQHKAKYKPLHQVKVHQKHLQRQQRETKNLWKR